MPDSARDLGPEISRLAGDLVQAGWEQVVRLGAVGPRSRRARRFRSFGAKSMITFPWTVLTGEGRIAIGAGTIVGPLATLSAGFPSQTDIRGEPIVTIGDRCSLGKGIGIVGHDRIELGDDIWTGHFVYVTDQNHGYEDLDVPVGLQLWKNSPVTIGSGCWLGHGSVVLPGSRLGRNVVVAAGAVVAGIEAPDHVILAGVPARIVREHVDGEGWRRPPGLREP